MSSILDRHCAQCDKTKFIIDFYTNTSLTETCKQCTATAKSIESGLWGPKALYTRAKAVAKQRKKPFLISLDEYVTVISQPCYYCNGLLNDGKNRGIGLDRKDNSKGYENNNILSSCGFCNNLRGDRLSIDEMKKVAELIISLRSINSEI